MVLFDVLIGVFCLAVMLVGLAGIVTPRFPGIHLVWFGIFLYAVVTGFAKITPAFLAAMAVIVLLSYALDYWNVRLGMKRFHATWHGVVGAVIGGLSASFFGIVPGLTIGPLFGAIVGEMLAGRDSVFSMETEKFRIVGYVGSTVVKIMFGVAMIGSWIWQLVPSR